MIAHNKSSVLHAMSVRRDSALSQERQTNTDHNHSLIAESIVCKVTYLNIYELFALAPITHSDRGSMVSGVIHAL